MGKEMSILSATTGALDASLYRPKSQLTAGVYKEILAIVQSILSGESSDTLQEAAHEVLSIMKADENDQVRRKRLSSLLSAASVTDEVYASLFRLCGLITDFVTEEEGVEAESAGAGIAVTFDEEDEEEGFASSSGDEDLGAEHERRARKLLEEKEPVQPAQEEEAETEAGRPAKGDPNEIPWKQFEDGFWLRRELFHLNYHEDEIVSLEQSTLELIRVNLVSNAAIENKLFQLFKFKNMPLCKLIVTNKFKLWLGASIALNPQGKASFIAQLLELTDPRASELYKELTAGQRDVTMDDSARLPQPSTLLDLSSLTFDQGGRLMSNPSFTPETKTFQISKKNYDEVHVQAAAKVQVPASDLVKVKNSLPQWAHAAFAGFETFNPIQSRVFPVAFGDFRENILMCAPTGAGKTNVAMLTVMNVLAQYWQEDRQAFNLSAFKIVYIAPMKALVQEVVKSFSVRLNVLGISVRELSGDANISREQMAETNVIVTTPEKWDVVTRKAGDSKSFTQLVRLVIIDEVHLLHDSRGPVLEAIVARTVRQIEQTREYVRIVALSATLPNYHDVALFLRVNPAVGLFYFGAEYRPVPLEQTYVGITAKKGLTRAQVTNEVVFEKVMEDVGTNQILVFVHGRKETWKTARELRNLAMEKNELGKFLPSDSASKGILEHEASKVKTTELKELLPFGIGIHHAGLPAADRGAVEDLFAARHLNVVVCTLTLAWGVNLPAHTVIIKGTQIYMPEKGDWVELSYMDMMQMMGRAGRPQYDSSGHGIVITNKSELQYYLSLNNMQLPIESQLLSVLADMVNAELALGTVSSRDDVVEWLGYTYLYVRMVHSPGLYGVDADEAVSDPKLLQRRVDLAHTALTQLDKNGLCKYDRRSGQAQATALGRVASHFYLRSESVATYNQHLKPSMSDMDLLRLFSLSREFKYIPVREEEKVELMRLVELVPVPIKGGAEDACSKINVLLQAFVSRLSLDGFALVADMVFVTQNAGRLFRALFEIAVKRGWSVLARKCLLWCKIVERRMWPIQTVLRQFKAVSDDVCRRIERKGLSNEDLSLMTPPEIGDIVRNARAGREIAEMLSQVPRVDATAYVQPLSRSTLLVKIDLQPDYEYSAAVHADTEIFWLFVEDVSQQHCLYSDQFGLKPWQVIDKATVTLTFTVPVTEPVPPMYFVRIISDRWMAPDVVRPVSFRHLVLPSKQLPFTELVDAVPVTVDSIDSSLAAQKLREWGISELNQIQTQSFESFFRSDANVVLFAPKASGKSLCVDLAVLRLLATQEGKKVVYVTPVDELARLKHRQWSGKFPELRTELLTGEPGQDLKIVEAADLVVATPGQWDVVSRKWRTKRTRRVFETIGLFVADNLHLLDGSVELTVSRMRYIAGSLEKECKIRLIGCGAGIANATDIANWLGASATFSFPSHVRAVPLEIAIHGIDVFNRNVRHTAMARPLYTNIISRAGDQPVIIFATDRKQCRSAAAELLLSVVAAGTPYRFLHSTEAVDIGKFSELALATSLAHGIGYIHGGLTDVERTAIVSFYRSGKIQVLFVTAELLWGLGLRASLVVVLDTAVYSAAEQQYTDYRAVEVLEMLGAAGRPGIDKAGKCVLFCANSKRDFYKKFIFEPLPVESVLDESLVEYVNAEVSSGTIKSRQDCIDWLTWTLLYRRIVQNPNFYSLQATSHAVVSDFLSGLVEDSVDALKQAGMITEEVEEELAPGDLGLVASYYSVATSTVESFRRQLHAGMKRKQLIELLAQAAEFNTVPSWPEDSAVLLQISQTLGLGLDADRFASPDGKSGDSSAKVLVLIHAHVNRIALPIELQSELDKILPIAHRLVLALVDVVSTCGWLKVALSAMEIAPMLVQAMLPAASPLLQLPFFDAERCEQAATAFQVEDVVDVLAMDDGDRTSLLSGLSESEVAQVARACNMFPSIALTVEKTEEAIHVVLEREGDLVLDRRGLFVPVFAPLFPKQKEEGWWLVLGNEAGEIEDLKRVTIWQQSERVSVRPSAQGPHKLFLMSDSFIGCDQEESV